MVTVDINKYKREIIRFVNICRPKSLGETPKTYTIVTGLLPMTPALMKLSLDNALFKESQQ